MYTSNKAGTVPCACTTIKKVSRLLGRIYDGALADSEINITQHAVMKCIVRRAEEPLSRVAEELEMDRTSLYRAVAPMVRDGWIEMTAGTDARSRSAKVTRKGAQVIAKAQSRVDRVQGHLLETFGRNAFDTLVGELNRLAVCADTVETH